PPPPATPSPTRARPAATPESGPRSTSAATAPRSDRRGRRAGPRARSPPARPRPARGGGRRGRPSDLRVRHRRLALGDELLQRLVHSPVDRRRLVLREPPLPDLVG